MASTPLLPGPRARPDCSRKRGRLFGASDLLRPAGGRTIRGGDDGRNASGDSRRERYRLCRENTFGARVAIFNVAIFNNDERRAIHATLSTGTRTRKARLWRLTAPSVESTAGVQLAEPKSHRMGRGPRRGKSACRQPTDRTRSICRRPARRLSSYPKHPG